MQISWPKSTWPDLRSVKDRVQQAEASGAPKEIQEPRFCGVFCCPPVCYSHKKADIESALLFCRSEEHTSELQSLMRISYAVFCLKKKKNSITKYTSNIQHYA